MWASKSKSWLQSCIQNEGVAVGFTKLDVIRCRPTLPRLYMSAYPSTFYKVRPETQLNCSYRFQKLEIDGRRRLLLIKGPGDNQYVFDYINVSKCKVSKCKAMQSTTDLYQYSVMRKVIFPTIRSVILVDNTASKRRLLCLLE